MTPEKLFQELLGLGLNWEVTESRFERESGTVFLEIHEKPFLWESARCPREGGLVFCYDHTEVLTWRHLNVFQHHCEITCRLPRGKCRQCGPVFRVRPPWEGLSLHFTKEFEAFALLLIREMPMAKVAEITGVTDMRLWRMLFKHIDGAYAQADFCNVCCVGVDEMSVRRGHEYISVFADLVARKVIFATEGHGHERWEAFVQALQAHNGHRHAITPVSMDMSAGYQKGVPENGHNAQVVFDKFHALANASKAVDQVRRAESRVGGEEVRDSLQKSQWLWRKNPENLNEEEAARLAKIKEKNLCTGQAYQMRLVLQDIYRSPDALMAQRRFKVWCRWVQWVARFYKSYVFSAMVRMADQVESHLPGILAHWKWGLTNAFMEGLNSVFSAVKPRARGFRSPVYLTTMLYLVAGKLRLPHV
jgi:transposase